MLTADLTATTLCDSAGVEVLARARDLAAARGVEFRLALGGSPVARILQLTGPDEVVPLYRDVPHSLATLRPARAACPVHDGAGAGNPQDGSADRGTAGDRPPHLPADGDCGAPGLGEMLSSCWSRVSAQGSPQLPTRAGTADPAAASVSTGSGESPAGVSPASALAATRPPRLASAAPR